MRKAIVAGLALGLLAVPGLTGCNTTPTQDGALMGSLLGAGAGAIIGNQSGKQGEGALIGAGAGALAGALVGDQVDEHRKRYRHAPYNSTVQSQPSAYSQPYTQAAPAERVVRGRYETRIVTGPNGETYEERVFIEER